MDHSGNGRARFFCGGFRCFRCLSWRERVLHDPPTLRAILASVHHVRSRRCQALPTSIVRLGSGLSAAMFVRFTHTTVGTDFSTPFPGQPRRGRLHRLRRGLGRVRPDILSMVPCPLFRLPGIGGALTAINFEIVTDGRRSAPGAGRDHVDLHVSTGRPRPGLFLRPGGWRELFRDASLT